MSYLDNPGNRLVRNAFQLYGIGPRDLRLTRERPPELPQEYAAATVNALIPALLDAEKARQFADSWRQFLVGAAAVAYFYSPAGARKMTFAHGANAKPVEGSDIINVHAEHTVMSIIDTQRRPNESVYVPVLAVVGDLQPDQQSGEATATLHPCGVCREAFDHEDTPIDNRTLIVTANPGLTTIEWLSLDALNKVHKSGDNTGGQATFDSRSPILTPPDLEGKAFLRLSDFDTPEMDANAREYDEKVRDRVFRYVMQMISDK